MLGPTSNQDLIVRPFDPEQPVFGQCLPEGQVFRQFAGLIQHSNFDVRAVPHGPGVRLQILHEHFKQSGFADA